MKNATKQKFLMLATVAFISAPLATAMAVGTQIEATAEFQTALTLAGNVDIDFDVVEFSAAPIAGTTATIGTNGAVTYAGNFTGAGTGTPGEVEIATGNVGSTVEIFCDATATLSNGSGASIGLDNIQVSFTPSAPGAGSACAGSGTAATTRLLAGGGADVILFGARLNGGVTTAFVAGSYSTATGGDDIQVDVFYQ